MTSGGGAKRWAPSWGRLASLGLGALGRVWAIEASNALEAGELQPKDPRGPVAETETPLGMSQTE